MSQLVEVESGFSHSFTVSNTILRPLHYWQLMTARRSLLVSTISDNRGYFYCLCCVVAYEGRHRRNQSRSDYLSSVHAALNLRSFLGAG